MPRNPTRPPDGPGGPPPWAHGSPPRAGLSSGARWLIIEYAHSWDGDSLYVACTTDLPCHLWLQWTDKEEQMHLHEKVIRGLSIMGDPKYCFVEWRAVEQAEEGDTTSHTFNFPSWSACQRRWWTFTGTEDGVESPSNTCIFTAHYEDQEAADSLKHTDLIDKDPDDVIDHADKSVTGDKLVDDLAFGTFPTTPDANPDADLEVPNKRYVDAAAGAGLWVPIETKVFSGVTYVDFTNIPPGYRTLMFCGTLKTVVAGGEITYANFNGDSGVHYTYRVSKLGATYDSTAVYNQGRTIVAAWGYTNRWTPFELMVANGDDASPRTFMARNSHSEIHQIVVSGVWHTGCAEINRVMFAHDRLNGLTGQIALAGIPAP